ncbi:MAG: methyl-accepting chemotaxis protein [Pirellula sp.]|jgi:methyl-accepting chemotaxis protein|nr:methyl-accepting chemotaxis protein [Pirellula sp.]
MLSSATLLIGTALCRFGDTLIRLSGNSSASLESKNQALRNEELLATQNATGKETAIQAEIELLTMGRTISVLERQIAEVNQDIETSIVGISRGFQGMAKQAQTAISTAGAAAGDRPADRIAEMQDVVKRLVHDMGESCDSLNGASQKLIDVEKRLDIVESVLYNIEKIASQSRLVALNGEIEARRLGDAGKAFAVVAAETKSLSQHATETSRSIRELLSELTSVVTSTTSDLSARSQSDAKRLSQSKQEAEALLSYIHSDHNRMTESLAETEKIGRELQGNISNAVMSLQFQDRVSQRIHHVVDSLKVLRSRAEETADPVWQNEAETRCLQLLQQLSSQYTMESERAALLNDKKTGVPSSETFDVELF